MTSYSTYLISKNPAKEYAETKNPPKAIGGVIAHSPTGEGVLPLLDGCWICSLWSGSWGRELMTEGKRKGYSPGV